MQRNPKIVHWLEIGIKRFAESGIEGIHIEDMSKEIGVAKSSFYFFFNSKKEYLNQLFAYWELEGTDRLIAMVNYIEDPVKRFLALAKLIEDNAENEFFYFQLRLYAHKNEHARKYVDSVSQKRINIASGIFKDAGQSDAEAFNSGLKMQSFFCGIKAMMMGYTREKKLPKISEDELLIMFGLKQ